MISKTITDAHFPALRQTINDLAEFAKRAAEPAPPYHSYPDQYPMRSFVMLVAGQRHGVKLDVHQAWRVYPDIAGMTPQRWSISCVAFPITLDTR
jgi:hypothetical protein